MKLDAAKKLIEKELKDLDVPVGCDAYKLVYEQACAAADVMNQLDLVTYIEHYLADLPPHMFEV